MKVFVGIVLGFITVVLMGFIIFVSCTPQGVRVWNGYKHSLQSADDDTSYQTRKEVEDTCRAMIASYNADKLTYEQYKDSDNTEKQSWAEQAKMRANKTASTYNNYILKNNYVWRNDVPADIYGTLSYIE